MKKIFALFLSIFCILTIFTACKNSGEQPKIAFSETTKIDVLHYVGGQEEKWTIDDKADIDNLVEWLSNLMLELKQFDEGNSPGDGNGGEVYMFTLDSDEFSYIINGSNDCYILYKTDWYQVENPTDPFD